MIHSFCLGIHANLFITTMSKKHTPSPTPVNSIQKTGGSRLFNLRLIMVIVAVGIALYGLRHFLATRDVNRNQDELAVSADDASEKEALVPVNQGRSWKEIDDPSKDGWDTEVLANQAKKQLQVLGSMLANLDGVDGKNVSKLVADGFACEPLRPTELTKVIDDAYLKIERAASAAPLPDLGKPAPGKTGMTGLKHRGADGLLQAMRIAFAPFGNVVDLHFKGKVFKVLKTADGVITRQYVSLSGNKPGDAKSPGKIELHATWDIGWVPGADGAKPRMQWIRIVEFEQTESHQPGGAFFVDCTKSVLGGSRVFAKKNLRGMNHWFERIQGTTILSSYQGLTVGDVNGDGLDDLYVCQEVGLPNRLFIQNADGTASEESAQ